MASEIWRRTSYLLDEHCTWDLHSWIYTKHTQNCIYKAVPCYDEREILKWKSDGSELFSSSLKGVLKLETSLTVSDS